MKTTLCCSLLVALAAFTGASEARSNYIPRTERGQLVANLVERWSPEAAQRMKTTPGAWANAMAGAFAKAPMKALRRAVAAGKFDDMVGTLDLSASYADGPMSYHQMTPCRFVDTRTATKMAAGETRTFDLHGWSPGTFDCGVSEAKLVALKVTAIDSEGSGTLSVLSEYQVVSPATALNFSNQVLDNHRVDVSPLTSVFEDRNIRVFSTNSTHLLIDVVGWYSPVYPTTLNCYRTAEVTAFVLDQSSSTVVNAPACGSGSVQTATFCRSGSKSTVLLGTKDKECVFADATPNGVGGSAYAASKCCSVQSSP